jgi:hypothetical protein
VGRFKIVVIYFLICILFLSISISSSPFGILFTYAYYSFPSLLPSPVPSSLLLPFRILFFLLSSLSFTYDSSCLSSSSSRPIYLSFHFLFPFSYFFLLHTIPLFSFLFFIYFYYLYYIIYLYYYLYSLNLSSYSSPFVFLPLFFSFTSCSLLIYHPLTPSLSMSSPLILFLLFTFLLTLPFHLRFLSLQHPHFWLQALKGLGSPTLQTEESCFCITYSSLKGYTSICSSRHWFLFIPVSQLINYQSGTEDGEVITSPSN